MQPQVISVNAGKPQSYVYGGKELSTGIFKSPVSSPLYLHKNQLEGDGQADLSVHGGPDKALCAYCVEHYSYWERQLGIKLEPGAFGENLTLQGALEENVSIGDIFELGEAVVQVTQPRQPCHKIAKRHDAPDLPQLVQSTGYTGYYFRVLQEGIVPFRPQLKLIQKHSLGVSIGYANRIKYGDKQNREGIAMVLSVAELSESWRNSFTKRLSELEG